MADKSQAAWGIDIGQAGLKAVKLRYADAAKQAVAVAFDYVPHPKILSQPDAIPEELIPAALETFLSRNTVKGDKIVISVPGQTSLAKFIKLPPVEASKVSEIVKYEARQQIPFDLDDVIWDYQPLGGGVEESGFMLEAEVGLFAMKREQVQQQMQPFIDAGQEVEIVQTAPLALYNFLSYDHLGHRVENGDPPEADGHTILIDMGADNTTLLVSNGRGIWIRNVPIGGNHFTRALTKEMKLTFAKAEHLKCNATRSPDPRAVFQALRPVFNNYVSEIQRSIGYFSSVNREAAITKVLGVGNGFKLAGLQKFLQQNLQYEVERVETYNGLVGDSVLNSSLFQDNIMSFTVPYGLALQGLGVTRIHTSLLPPEIAMERTIRRKKPWAIAAAAGLLTVCSLSAFASARSLGEVHTDRWDDKGHKVVKNLVAAVGKNTSDYEAQVTTHNKIKDDGQALTGALDRRELWVEVYKAINECQPRDRDDKMRDEDDPSRKDRLKLTSVTAKKVPDLAKWFKAEKEAVDQGQLRLYMQERDRLNDPPAEAGYVFTVVGSHYRNDYGLTQKREDMRTTGKEFVKNYFLKNLEGWTVQNGGKITPVRQLGISHAYLVDAQWQKVMYDPNQTSGGSVGGKARKSGGSSGAARGPSAGNGMSGGAGLSDGGGGGLTDGGGSSDDGSSSGSGLGASGQVNQKKFDIYRKATKDLTEWQFVIKFAWKPTPVADRLEEEPKPKKTSEDDSDSK